MHALTGVATLIRLNLEPSPLAQGAAQGLWQSRYQARHLAVLSGSLKKDAVRDPALCLAICCGLESGSGRDQAITSVIGSC